MPKYKVRSGSFVGVVETPFPADPQALVVMAMTARPDPESLGLIVEVSGGRYRGNGVVYLETASVLIAMGLMGRRVSLAEDLERGW